MPATINCDLPCPKCQYNWRMQPAGGKCPECGRPIPPLPEKLSGWIDCPRCGKKNLATSAFCYICRETLPAYLVPAEVFERRRRQARPRPVLITPAVFSLTVMVVGVVVALVLLPMEDGACPYTLAGILLAINILILINGIRHNRRVAAVNSALDGLKNSEQVSETAPADEKK